jgi:sulfocyanin
VQSTPTPTPAPTPTPTPSASSSQYLTIDSASQTVTLTLNITGFNFNGDSSGKMTVQVPQGWKVTVDCNNKATIAHSCAIVQGKTSTTVAFSGASTTNPTQGIQPGTSQSFTFTASTAGQYNIVCLVPGHEAAGMWDNFVVTSSGSPSITT